MHLDIKSTLPSPSDSGRPGPWTRISRAVRRADNPVLPIERGALLDYILRQVETHILAMLRVHHLKTRRRFSDFGQPEVGSALLSPP